MAVQFVITPEEMKALVEGLELVKLREFDGHAPQSAIHKQDIDDIHRKFHYHVVRWTQAMGYKSYNG